MSILPTIQIENLNHSFGEGNLQKPVLIDINLEIHAGEIIILTGPSGSGKTTLLTLIGALRSMQEGSLKILDRELKGASQKELVATRNRIGFIFQAHNLLNWTVRSSLLEEKY
jgi:putative ABC transport system ATP-binding protein